MEAASALAGAESDLAIAAEWFPLEEAAQLVEAGRSRKSTRKRS